MVCCTKNKKWMEMFAIDAQWASIFLDKTFYVQSGYIVFHD